MKKARVLIGVAGGMGAAVLAHKIGLRNVIDQMRSLGIVLPIAVMAGLIRLLLQTRAWMIALRADGIAVPQSRLVRARLVSQAAGYLTSLGPGVAEPAKMAMLRDRADISATAPATLVETGAYWLTTVALGLAGAVAAAFLAADARPVWVALVIFGAGLALLTTKRSLVEPLARLAGAKAPKWLHSAGDGEIRVRSFRDRHPAAARSVLFLDAIAQAVTLIEVATVLWAVGFRFSVAQVLAIEAAGRLVKILAVWIPGRIGADESGAAASFALFGLPPAAGLMLAFARRVRDLLWCVAGLLCAAGMSGELRAAQAPVGRPVLCLEEY